jgi:membrane-associated HD superfamily phosphohydrolase
MQYFYHKALEVDPSGTVKVDDFRYPGPKPQSRETAIVMLADGVEASTRSLRRPTPSRIREMTRKIFDRKLAEGELEECGLSLRDLAKIRESFIPILVGIHHHRVAYPGQREHEERKEKERVESRSRSRKSGTSVASGA